MSIAEWCILVAVLLYLLTVAPVKALGHRDFDNARPRDPAFYAHPIRERALGAHVNGIETFPFFAVAIVLAEFKKAPQAPIDALSVAFVVVRLAFVIAYLTGRPTLRTLLWNVGFFVNLAVFLLPLF